MHLPSQRQIPLTAWSALSVGVFVVIAISTSVPELSAVTLSGCGLAGAALAGLRSRRDRIVRSVGATTVAPELGLILLAALLYGPVLASAVAAVGYGVSRCRRSLEAMALEALSGATLGAIAGTVLDSMHSPVAIEIAAAAAAMQLVLWAHLLAEAVAARARLRFDYRLVGMLVFTNVVLPGAIIAAAAHVIERPLVAIAVGALVALMASVLARWLCELHRLRGEASHLREALSVYTPSALISRGDGEQQVQLGGEQRQITALFCDVRGFTAWAENKDPDSVILELNGLLGDLSQAVLETGGTLDKFTGDGLMAFWGAPTEQPDHAARAYRTALKMFEQVARCNERRDELDKPEFVIGVGLHSGLTMVGNVGHAKRINYTAVGDTVNLTARLESATADGEYPLLLSEATFLNLPYELQRECVRLDSIRVKGRTDAVQVYSAAALRRGATEELAA